MLCVGKKAPLFALPDADLETIDIADFIGKSNIILFFYPKDDTPSCTLEATAFSDMEPDFERYKCTIIGVNRDDCLKHAEFRDKHGISIRLLSDADGAVCKLYGVLQTKEVDGIQKEGIVRSTFIIDKEGTLKLAQYGVTAKGHAQEILRAVKEMKL